MSNNTWAGQEHFCGMCGTPVDSSNRPDTEFAVSYFDDFCRDCNLLILEEEERAGKPVESL